MSSDRIWAVIPAAGIGSRMNSDIPKQYLKIEDKTVLEYAIDRFLEHSQIHKVVVALNPNDQYWADLPYKDNPRVITVQGGDNRVDSVLSGLDNIADSNDVTRDWVMVHDAARPCLSANHIDDLIKNKESSPDGAILAIGAIDTVKIANARQSIDKTIDRDSIWLAQTPQFFPLQALRHSILKALEQGDTVTDEASAMELSGYHPALVIGSRKNLKITEPEDLLLASIWLNHGI
ncbi:2-C-methyl-D-erythritol 4-phosphate cytidylyltransferase [Kangiella geojedonensis]|uniref:2-C-methyl-D-erythritol 4-phosphate cytidylyltransferase n=1 Tax=Kangiella geojedonensis TaxID=914150 RepID=A0A0F6TRQ2_9GAMM|nr:2-C-methyl-D-erythritol 4-phosphate cytidylyltransferase [Kangiella geojedonensis]AKE52417.1 2-C-methyl-D-erythritol 4-phosphate cytidylyltransferase [Kangiella geojedonensis]